MAAGSPATSAAVPPAYSPIPSRTRSRLRASSTRCSKSRCDAGRLSVYQELIDG